MVPIPIQSESPGLTEQQPNKIHLIMIYWFKDIVLSRSSLSTQWHCIQRSQRIVVIFKGFSTTQILNLGVVLTWKNNATTLFSKPKQLPRHSRDNNTTRELALHSQQRCKHLPWQQLFLWLYSSPFLPNHILPSSDCGFTLLNSHRGGKSYCNLYSPLIGLGICVARKEKTSNVTPLYDF